MLSGGGINARSFAADHLKVNVRMTPHAAAMKKVLRFQCVGRQNQPPAGDQTHLGYGNGLAPMPALKGARAPRRPAPERGHDDGARPALSLFDLSCVLWNAFV